MMCGCKHTFRVSWGLGQGVKGLGDLGLGARDHEHRVEHHDVAVETFLWQQSGTFTARYNRHRLEPSQATPIQTATSDRLATLFVVTCPTCRVWDIYLQGLRLKSMVNVVPWNICGKEA